MSVRKQKNTPLLVVLFYSHNLSISKGFIWYFEDKLDIFYLKIWHKVWLDVRMASPFPLKVLIGPCKHFLAWEHCIIFWEHKQAGALQIFHGQQSFSSFSNCFECIICFCFINGTKSLCTSSSGKVRIQLLLSKKT